MAQNWAFAQSSFGFKVLCTGGYRCALKTTVGHRCRICSCNRCSTAGIHGGAGECRHQHYFVEWLRVGGRVGYQREFWLRPNDGLAK